MKALLQASVEDLQHMFPTIYQDGMENWTLDTWLALFDAQGLFFGVVGDKYGFSYDWNRQYNELLGRPRNYYPTRNEAWQEAILHGLEKLQREANFEASVKAEEAAYKAKVEARKRGEIEFNFQDKFILNESNCIAKEKFNYQYHYDMKMAFLSLHRDTDGNFWQLNTNFGAFSQSSKMITQEQARKLYNHLEVKVLGLS